MDTRRNLIFGAAAGLGLVSASPVVGQAITGRASARKVGGAPKMITGTPNKLDFGGGLLIPMDRTIFGALWEGQDRWITYGRGVAVSKLRAMGEAVDAAQVSMETLMITLAFKPERMEKTEGSGWRLKSKNPADLLHGRMPLPGKPLMPVVNSVGGGGSVADEVTTGAEGDMMHAVTGFMVMKNQITLDDVRKRARLFTEEELQARAAKAKG